MGQALSTQRIAIVVEDDRDQADLAAVLLEEADFEVIEVSSADDALAVVVERGADVALVFTDIWFDRSADGVDLARGIASRWPWIKLIVTSGNPGEQLQRLPRGATYMQKPWRALDLLSAADRVTRC